MIDKTDLCPFFLRSLVTWSDARSLIYEPGTVISQLNIILRLSVQTIPLCLLCLPTAQLSLRSSALRLMDTCSSCLGDSYSNKHLHLHIYLNRIINHTSINTLNTLNDYYLQSTITYMHVYIIYTGNIIHKYHLIYNAVATNHCTVY